MTIRPATADRLDGAPDVLTAGGARPGSSDLAPPTSPSPEQPPTSEHEAAYNLDADCRIVLDIGADVGALVLYAPPDLVGTEVEISRATEPGTPRTHAVVREHRAGHQAPGGTTFAAVYPGLPAGAYTIWREASTPGGASTPAGHSTRADDSIPAGTVQICGGAVATWRWEAG